LRQERQEEEKEDDEGGEHEEEEHEEEEEEEEGEAGIASITAAVNLQRLHLQHNLLTYFGGSSGAGLRDLTRLTQLRDLRLDNNYLQALPRVLGALSRNERGFPDISRPSLSSLRSVRAEYNRFKELPLCLGYLSGILSSCSIHEALDLSSQYPEQPPHRTPASHQRASSAAARNFVLGLGVLQGACRRACIRKLYTVLLSQEELRRTREQRAAAGGDEGLRSSGLHQGSAEPGGAVGETAREFSRELVHDLMMRAAEEAEALLQDDEDWAGEDERQQATREGRGHPWQVPAADEDDKLVGRHLFTDLGVAASAQRLLAEHSAQEEGEAGEAGEQGPPSVEGPREHGWGRGEERAELQGLSNTRDALLLLRLRKLAVLLCSDRGLQGAPTAALRMPFLQSCVLSGNRLERIPSELAGTAPFLWFLDLSCNLIAELDASVQDFVSLEELDLSDNVVVAVSPACYRAPSLRRVGLYSNPLTNPLASPSIASLPTKMPGSRSRVIFVF